MELPRWASSPGIKPLPTALVWPRFPISASLARQDSTSFSSTPSVSIGDWEIEERCTNPLMFLMFQSLCSFASPPFRVTNDPTSITIVQQPISLVVGQASSTPICVTAQVQSTGQSIGHAAVFMAIAAQEPAAVGFAAGIIPNTQAFSDPSSGQACFSGVLLSWGQAGVYNMTVVSAVGTLSTPLRPIVVTNPVSATYILDAPIGLTLGYQFSLTAKAVAAGGECAERIVERQRHAQDDVEEK